MAQLVHTCSESEDPRHAGSCACGKRMYRWRNIDVERLITEQACRGFVDPQALITYSEARADRLSREYVTNPMQVLLDRDRPRDTREELADARNHLVWAIEDNPEHPDLDRWMRALGLICQAYALLVPED